MASCNWCNVRSATWICLSKKPNFPRESRNSIRKRSTGRSSSLCFSVSEQEKSKGDNESEKMVPRHLAVIMDGNGRWAQSRGQPVSAGHAAGVESLDCLLQNCLKWKIKFVSVFALSVENKNHRCLDEIEFLLNLVKSVITSKLGALHEAGVRVKFIGDVSSLKSADSLQRAMHRAETQTQTNSDLVLTIALNYSGKRDMVDCVQRIATMVGQGDISAEDISAGLIAKNLSMGTIAVDSSHQHIEPDLLIRTGGEKRISNFMLWELAYTEFYFTDTYWPDFGLKDFEAALKEFQARERRFGSRPY